MNSNNPLNIRRVKGQKWKGEETPADSLCKGSSKRPTKSTPGERPLSSNVASPLGEEGLGEERGMATPVPGWCPGS